ncbi:hypothetical protein QD172_02945 [Cobetia sp. 10Alg 146]|uniref:hypothetical protein n=1 Tax=Cobetia sp. 10Alg 146 TaxID=3040019 RepID=UPI00244776D4|nr:hypothetical protein [Cobetia sp. 10Alg 146]MDH2290209.1 hypothetical protein [Cobetia sp. 10Alg 146]
MQIAQHMDAFVTLVVTVGVLVGLAWDRRPVQWLVMAADMSLLLLGVNIFSPFGHAIAVATLLLAVRLLALPPHLLTAYIAYGCRLLFQSRSRESHLAWLLSRQGARRGLSAPHRTALAADSSTEMGQGCVIEVTQRRANLKSISLQSWKTARHQKFQFPGLHAISVPQVGPLHMNRSLLAAMLILRRTNFHAAQ